MQSRPIVTALIMAQAIRVNDGQVFDLASVVNAVQSDVYPAAAANAFYAAVMNVVGDRELALTYSGPGERGNELQRHPMRIRDSDALMTHQLGVFWNFTYPEPGLYWLRLLDGDNVLAEKPIPVLLAVGLPTNQA